MPHIFNVLNVSFLLDPLFTACQHYIAFYAEHCTGYEYDRFPLFVSCTVHWTARSVSQPR